MDRIVILVRHAKRADHLQKEDPEKWQQRSWKKRVKNKSADPFDPPLTKIGRHQANKVSEKILLFLKEQKISEEEVDIYSSPFLRCLETAFPTLRTLNIPAHIEYGLGKWMNDVPMAVDHSGPLDVYKDVLSSSHISFSDKGAPGESRKEMKARFQNTMKNIFYRSPKRVLIVFTHRCGVDTLIFLLTGKRFRPIPHASLTFWKFSVWGKMREWSNITPPPPPRKKKKIRESRNFSTHSPNFLPLS